MRTKPRLERELPRQVKRCAFTKRHAVPCFCPGEAQERAGPFRELLDLAADIRQGRRMSGRHGGHRGIERAIKRPAGNQFALNTG